MRILIMGNNDQSGGGLIVHYIALVNYLKNAGFNMICIDVNDNMNKIFLDNSISEITVPYKPKSLMQKVTKYIQLRRAVSMAKKFKPDVFIATALGYGYAMVAEGLPKDTYKIFQEVHFEATADVLRMKMVKCFDAVAVQTNGMRMPFLKNVSSLKPVAALPCFAKQFATAGFEKIPSVQKEIRLAYFGRLAWNKGLKQFIQAAHEIFTNNPDLIFDIYGSGPEKDSILEEIKIRKVQNQIRLKGFYNDDEFAALLNCCHGIIIPSIDTEGLPLVLIETMRFGRPAFVTTTGAMPEVASFNTEGMIVSEKDNVSLKKNLSIFINRIRQSKFDASYIHAVYKEHFSNEVFLQTWLSMLEDPRNYFTKTPLL
jgi:glycosyltransferase involved in cell wall biosynthesis